jgi:hypothetical protein
VDSTPDRLGSRTRPCLLIGCAALILSAHARAQEEQDLRTLVQELQQRNAELEQRMSELEADHGPDSDATESYGLTASYQDVRVTFQLFGDVGFGYQNPAPSDHGNSSFTFGTVDAFVTAQMGNHFQVLSESVLTGKDSEGHFEQERLWGAWTFDDRLYAKLGLEHSPISLWNSRYHHGTWLEPTIARPLLAGFEGSPSGFLPLHNSGLELGGSAYTGEGRFDYKLIVSNGRGDSPRDKQKVSDANDEKAVVVALALKPGAGPLRFGLAGQMDDIPADSGSSVPALTDSIQELIGTAFVETRLGPVELMAEAAAMRNETDADGEQYDHFSAYVQLLLPIKRWSPYLRFDVKAMDEGDPFLAQEDRDLDQWRQILGVRNDFATNAAFKLEFSFGERDERDTGGSIDQETFVGAAIQVAWAI